jgi:CheY-like chemotaxis protein
MARLAKEKFLVLMVEDAEGDCLLLRMAVSKTDRMHFIGSVSDGNELLGYMKGEGKYADRERYPLPDKMLLDLVMPRPEGFEVVEWLRGQPFDDMVVVVFAGSQPVQDVDQGFPLEYLGRRNATAGRRQNLVKLLEEYLSHK